MSAADAGVRIERVGSVAHLILDRPKALNALKALGVKTQTKLELSALQIHSAETGVPEGSKGSADGGTRRSQRLYINESA